MKRFARMLFAGLGIVIAGSAMSLVPHKAATAGGSAPVTILNPSLPVTQSGAWNVGINGTPNVAITNTPNVGITGTPSVNIGTPTVNLGVGSSVGINGTVQVASSASTPVLVKDLDNAARHAFQASTTLGLSGTTTSMDSTITTVPTGKLFVIESISVQALGLTGQKFLPSIVISSPPSPLTDAFRLRLPLSQSPQGNFNGEDAFIALFPTRLYAQGGTDVGGSVLISAPTGSPNVIVTCAIVVSGYLLDCGPGSGCPLP